MEKSVIDQAITKVFTTEDSTLFTKTMGEVGELHSTIRRRLDKIESSICDLSKDEETKVLDYLQEASAYFNERFLKIIWEVKS